MKVTPQVACLTTESSLFAQLLLKLIPFSWILEMLRRVKGSFCVSCFDQIREELRANGIDVYPQKEFDEDAEDRMINEKIRV